VRLRTNRPGHPLLLKVSYHPRWRADDGSPILEVAPALMLVLPRHETVELGFATPAWMRAAGALSAGTVAALVVVLLRRRRPSDPAPAAVAADRVTRRLRLAVGLLAAAGPLVAVAWRPADPQTLLARAQAARREAGCGVAGPAYARVVAAAPSSYPALEARLEQGRCAFEAEDWQAARDLSHRFVVDYPAHPFSAEAQRWLTESRKRLEDSANGGSAGGS
jgi:hypothetical protein